MKEIFKKIFRKNDEAFKTENSNHCKFSLKINDLEMGILELKDGYWHFNYTETFRQQEKYRRITGFSNLSKTYKADYLWPFFKIRIPGLKQPMIEKIIKNEKLDINNEAGLLHRFGRRISKNPYILEPIETGNSISQ